MMYKIIVVPVYLVNVLKCFNMYTSAWRRLKFLLEDSLMFMYDLVGPLPSSHGYTYLLTCIDRSTWWPEVIPLTGISTAEYVSALFQGLISRFGVPSIITSDRGTQFTSSLWSNICSLLNINHITTTAFHP